MSSVTVRAPAVAGTFYTADPAALARTVDQFIAGAPADERPAPKALVVPHAGYLYSGEVAGRGYARLRPRAPHITRVVLLGPAHKVPVRSMAVPSVDRFRTPLGDVPVDTELRSTALACDGVTLDDRAHGPEHSLEVHLPFLQRLLPHGFTLLPVVVGVASPGEVATLLERVWGGPETLVLVSSDLSHYEPYDHAARHDAATAHSIVQRALEQIDTHDACGAHPLRGLLALARTRGLQIEQIDLRSSGDTAGDRSRVVGYGAFAVHEHTPVDAVQHTGASALAHDETATLLDTAVGALETHLGATLRAQTTSVDDARITPRLRLPGASFVTLRDAAHDLRGCIGSLEPRRPLVDDVALNAVAAASRDPRFPPTGAGDLRGGEVHVSVLSPHEPVEALDRGSLLAALRPGRDGLLIEAGHRRATFLPSVWEQLPRSDDFLDHLWQKAGLDPRAWPADLRAWRYASQDFATPLSPD